MSRFIFSGSSKLFKKYLLSYSLIIVISLVISMVSYHFSVKVIEYEITKANINSLNQVKTASDSTLKGLEKLYIQIGFDQRLQMLMSLQGDMQPAQLIELSKLQADLKRFKVANPLIKEIYIYFRRSGLVLIDSGSYTPDVFYDFVFHYNADIFQGWIDSPKGGITITPEGDNGTDGENLAAYIQPLPIGKTSEHPGKMIILLDNKIIRKTMDELRWIPESSMFVINSENRLYVRDKELSIPSGLSYDLLQETARVDKKNNIVISYSPSGFCDWKYVSVIPVKIFFDRAANVKNAVLISLAVFLVTGLAVSLFFSRKYYRPMDQLMQYIHIHVKESITKEEDEYKFIQKVLADTASEKEEILENRNRQSKRLKNEFLNRLVRGELDKHTIDEMRDIYHIPIDCSYLYMILLITVDESLLPAKANTAMKEEDNIADARLILSNMLEELLHEKYHPLLIESENQIICLIYSCADGSPIIPESVRQDIGNTIAMMKRQLRILFFTSVSDCHKGYDRIKLAYSEAEEAMEYHVLAGTDPVTYFGDLKSISRKVANYYFNKDLKQFYQIMQEKDFQNAIINIQRIFKTWLFNSNSSAYMIRYRMNEIIHVMVHSIEYFQLPNDEEFPEYTQVIDMLMKCKHSEDLQKHIINLTGNLNDYMNKKQEMEPDQHQKILRYIQIHYSLPDLNISAIADAFGMNVPYLSRQFKKSMGIGPLEYLQLLRIEKAKKLLEDSNHSLSEIMNSAGFVNEVSFIRVFKKYEGITPGLFRKKITGQVN